ncbi:MAG TPA: hypothetical protein VMU68_04820 [Acidimicrobiales bacterium]|nr:hypothetical protein [Acidimicrobiales bacterium]
MRQISRLRFGASKRVGKREGEHRTRRAARRTTWIIVALGAAWLGFSSTFSAAGATSATSTTTLPATIVAAGNAYALQLLKAQPIPPSAREVDSLPTPLTGTGDVAGGVGLRLAHRLYLLPMTVDVDQYVRAHVPSGEKVTETGTGGGPNVATVDTLGLSLTCVSPHITYCGVAYSTTEAKNGEQEMRVDVQVIYLPILNVKMPTSGVVTVTGFGKISLMNASNNPTSVVLTHHQVLALRRAIASLKDMSNSGFCAEDSLLLKIKIVNDGNVIWTATADECPGALSISSAKTNVTLYDRSCPFWHVVNSFFPSGAAGGTKTGSKVCVDSSDG